MTTGPKFWGRNWAPVVDLVNTHKTSTFLCLKKGFKNVLHPHVQLKNERPLSANTLIHHSYPEIPLEKHQTNNHCETFARWHKGTRWGFPDFFRLGCALPP